MRKNTLQCASLRFGILVLCAIALDITPAIAATICSNTTKNTLVVRNGRCRSGETTLTPTSFTGPAGTNGTNGTNGAAGARGVSAFDPIPSGTTVYGVIGNDGQEAGAGGHDWYGFSSLPALTSQVLTSSDILIAPSSVLDNDCVGALECRSAAEVTDGTVCTGSVNTPTAPAGKVCIYVSLLSSSNITPGTVVALVINSSAPTITPGFMIGWTANANGDTFLRGSWAYTAP